MRFLLLDKITSFVPGKSGTAIKNVSLSEDFFVDHFPLKPIMPGVLIIEGMAQLSGLVLEEGYLEDTGDRKKALMSIVEQAKFRNPVFPGDQLNYKAEILSMNELGGKAKATATVNGKKAAQCTLLFSFHKIENPRLEEHRDGVLSLWIDDYGRKSR
jgi:3-hydroxyacyl-[acyl-carrier-protein] dehydratase